MRLAKDFYHGSTASVATRLLGKYLRHEAQEGETVGRIVETEAYLGSDDAASHAFGGRTARNDAMFGEPGKAYIYFIYGMYYCLNVTTMPPGAGEAVLIRALEPVCGLSLMQERRAVKRPEALCNGPAKLVIAMGITPLLSGHDFRKFPLTIVEGSSAQPAQIVTTHRIGISKAAELPLRFHLSGSRFVSRRKTPTT